MYKKLRKSTRLTITGVGASKYIKYNGRLINRHISSFIFPEFINAIKTVNTKGWDSDDYLDLMCDITERFLEFVAPEKKVAK